MRLLRQVEIAPDAHTWLERWDATAAHITLTVGLGWRDCTHVDKAFTKDWVRLEPGRSLEGNAVRATRNGDTVDWVNCGTRVDDRGVGCEFAPDVKTFLLSPDLVLHLLQPLILERCGSEAGIREVAAEGATRSVRAHLRCLVETDVVR